MTEESSEPNNRNTLNERSMLSTALPSEVTQGKIFIDQEDVFAFGGNRPVYINRILLIAILNQLDAIIDDKRKFDIVEVSARDLYIRKSLSGKEYENFASYGDTLYTLSRESKAGTKSVKIGELTLQDISWASSVPGSSEPRYNLIFDSIHYDPEKKKIEVSLSESMRPILKKIVTNEGERLQIMAAYMYSLKKKNSHGLYRRFFQALEGYQECDYVLEVEEYKNEEEMIEGVDEPQYMTNAGYLSFSAYDSKVLSKREEDINLYTDIYCKRLGVEFDKIGRAQTNYRVLYRLSVNEANKAELKRLQDTDVDKRKQLAALFDKKSKSADHQYKYLSSDYIEKLKLTFSGLTTSELYFHYTIIRESVEDTNSGARIRELEVLIEKDKSRLEYQLWREGLKDLSHLSMSKIDSLLASCANDFKTDKVSYVNFVLDRLKDEFDELQPYETKVVKTDGIPLDDICDVERYIPMPFHEVLDLIKKLGDSQNYSRIIYTTMTLITATREAAWAAYTKKPNFEPYGKFDERKYVLKIYNKNEAADLKDRINSILMRKYSKLTDSSIESSSFKLYSEKQASDIHEKYKDLILRAVVSQLSDEHRMYYFENFKVDPELYRQYATKQLDGEYDFTIANMLMLESNHYLGQIYHDQIFEKEINSPNTRSNIIQLLSLTPEEVVNKILIPNHVMDKLIVTNNSQ